MTQIQRRPGVLDVTGQSAEVFRRFQRRGDGTHHSAMVRRPSIPGESSGSIILGVNSLRKGNLHTEDHSHLIENDYVMDFSICENS
jgi:hypothetical protein